ncbi:MAG TPA: SMR family transporter [Chitinophagaceae bacterium]|nr:SMR family transporter [Chitinophagaceae bacterium]
MAWLYLFIASIFEIGWTFSIKFLNVKKVLAIKWLHLFSDSTYFHDLLPLLGYIFLGIGNIVFFSMAIKQIPASTAMAVWIGVALIGVKIVDVTVFKQGYSFGELFFFGIILVGLIGLKSVTPAVK